MYLGTCHVDVTNVRSELATRGERIYRYRTDTYTRTNAIIFYPAYLQDKGITSGESLGSLAVTESNLYTPQPRNTSHLGPHCAAIGCSCTVHHLDVVSPELSGLINLRHVD